MDGTERRSPDVRPPRARALGYPDSTLDVVVRDERVELCPDATRPIGNSAWLATDRTQLVDLEAAR